MRATARKKPALITFESVADAQCIALAKLGQSDSVIERDCKLTQGQISYRLRKAKDAEGMGHGYRVAWRKGESDICKRVKEDLLEIVRLEIQRDMPVKLIQGGTK